MQDRNDQRGRGSSGDQIRGESAGTPYFLRDLEEQCDDWVSELRLVRQTQGPPFTIPSELSCTLGRPGVEPPTTAGDIAFPGQEAR
jgi:hypothetical protein